LTLISLHAQTQFWSALGAVYSLKISPKRWGRAKIDRGNSLCGVADYVGRELEASLQTVDNEIVRRLWRPRARYIIEILWAEDPAQAVNPSSKILLRIPEKDNISTCAKSVPSLQKWPLFPEYRVRAWGRLEVGGTYVEILVADYVLPQVLKLIPPLEAYAFRHLQRSIKASL
jgi:hypothetical protein